MKIIHTSIIVVGVLAVAIAGYHVTKESTAKPVVHKTVAVAKPVVKPAVTKVTTPPAPTPVVTPIKPAVK